MNELLRRIDNEVLTRMLSEMEGKAGDFNSDTVVYSRANVRAIVYAVVKFARGEKDKGLADKLREILERNYQLTQSGYCPWCGAEEFPVDENGKKITGQNVENAAQWLVEHDETCAVTMIEKLLRGDYIADELDED